MQILDEDKAVEIAHFHARAYQRDQQERHLDTISDLINGVDDPLNAAKKLARKCGRKLAGEFLDPKIVNAGARGWFRV